MSLSETVWASLFLWHVFVFPKVSPAARSNQIISHNQNPTSIDYMHLSWSSLTVFHSPSRSKSRKKMSFGLFMTLNAWSAASSKPDTLNSRILFDSCRGLLLTERVNFKALLQKATTFNFFEFGLSSYLGSCKFYPRIYLFDCWLVGF